MGFVTEEMVEQRDERLRKAAENAELRKQQLIEDFCDSPNLEDIAAAVAKEVGEQFARHGTVINVVVEASKFGMVRELEHDARCEYLLFARLCSLESNTASVQLLYRSKDGGSDSPRVYVTFSPPLGRSTV